MRRQRLALVIAACCMVACEPANEDAILEIDAIGAIAGNAFLDTDASGDRSADDQPAVGLGLALVRANTFDTVAVAQTSAAGDFLFDAIPVGEYDVVVPTSALGDSVSVVFQDPDDPSLAALRVTLPAGDTVDVDIGLGFPILTVEEARTLPSGRRVFVRAVATSAIGAVGDSALYIAGTELALRALATTGDAVSPGDSVLVLGRSGTRSGQPVLQASRVWVEATEASFDTALVDAETARSAHDGMLDAALVQLRDVVVTDTARASGRFQITVRDPSGSVVVTIPTIDVVPAYFPGNALDVTGLLVPRPGIGGVWEVRPRSPEDIIARD